MSLGQMSTNQREEDFDAFAPPLAHCPACGQPEQLVLVHGRGQCAHCQMKVMPCCDGAACESVLRQVDLDARLQRPVQLGVFRGLPDRLQAI
jgi:hypothetical protein